MIISPEQIYWLLTGNRLDDKWLLKFARHQGVDVPDSLRKNLSNTLKQKHNPSSTTINNVKRFLLSLVGRNEGLAQEFERIDSNLITSLSPSSLLEYIEEDYILFLKAANLDNSPISDEIRTIFDFFRKIAADYDDGDLSEHSFEQQRLKDDLLRHISLEDDIFIDTSNAGAIGPTFSLNIAMYIMACFDLTCGSYKESSVGKDVLNKLLADCKSGINKCQFYYYIFFWQQATDMTDECVAESLELNIRSFYRYKKGNKIKNSNLTKNILNNGYLYFIFPAFWLKIIEYKNIANQDIGQLEKKYSDYFKLAQGRLHN